MVTVKKRELKIILGILSLFAIINMFLFFNPGGASYNGISGAFVEEHSESPLNLSFIVFVGQWVILLLISGIAYTRFLAFKKDQLTQQDYEMIKHKKRKSETDLDVLYHLLQNKKKLNTKSIAELFKITKEKALEWGKILENHKLVTIEYPTFNHPEVKINEKEQKEGQTQEDKEKTGKPSQEDKTGKEQTSESPPSDGDRGSGRRESGSGEGKRSGKRDSDSGGKERKGSGKGEGKRSGKGRKKESGSGRREPHHSEFRPK